ncbi:nuclear transport factor 2 family protein [Streptomyces sp. NPDC057199]|uniref:nuclear transport factor 2 family protein n=1 Tax=Streptomyces sp. NPDC057199 TaxID=3346047 RepID=UPI00363F4130
MGMTATKTSAYVEVIRQFFDIGDERAEGDIAALFTEDVQVYFPKYGIGHGREALMEVGKGRYELFPRMTHHMDQFRFTEQGNTVVVEGTTEGETASGRSWDGRETIAGHFCSVFEFRDGRIARMHVYVDPDLGNEDADRYPWHKA